MGFGQKKKPANGWHKHKEVITDLSTPWLRFKAWINMLFVDHGFLRVFYTRHYPVVHAKLYRAMQPLPHQIRHAQKRGIKTIINLRGRRNCGSFYLEEDFCRQLGLPLINFPSHSRRPPTRDFITNAKAMFEAIEYPALMHCKSGADRAGLMAALFLVLHEGRPVEEALRQLSWRFGHIRQARTGVLDYFFQSYLDYRQAHLFAAEKTDFMAWVENVYDADETLKAFQARSKFGGIIDFIMRRE